MAEKRAQRRLAAILAADVVGYSRLLEQDEAGTLAALRERRRSILNPLVGEYQGRIVKVMGDGVLVEFGSAVNAVAAAVELQMRMTTANEGAVGDRLIELRIGVNLGDVVVEGGDLYGDGVIIAVRLQAMAEPGGVCLSGSVQEQVANKLPLEFDDLGLCDMKNIARPVRVFRTHSRSPRPRPVPTQPRQSTRASIAVLPFVNLSGDPQQQYFCDGITEDITTELARFRELSVAARNSSFVYRDKPTDVRQIGQEMNVQYVVEGSIRRMAERVRVTVQLVNTATGDHVWAERYDSDLENILELQDEITGAIVESLSGRIASAIKEQAKRKPPASWRAYDYLLMGIEPLFYSPRRMDDLNKARHCFEKAIEIDPRYARAHGNLAGCYNLIAFRTKGDGQAYDAAVACARRHIEVAVSLDGSDPDALLARGYTHLRDREFADADRMVGRAYAANPHNIDIAMSYVTLRSLIGKAKKAITLAEAIIQRNPDRADNHLWDLAVAHLFARHFEHAAGLFRQTSVRDDPMLVIAAYGYVDWIVDARREAELYVEELRQAWAGERDATMADHLRWEFEHNDSCKLPDNEQLLRGGLRKIGLPA